MREPREPNGFTPEMRASDLRLRFEQKGAVFVYDMAVGDQMTVGTGPEYTEYGAPSREILGELVDRGAFGVLKDSDKDLVGQIISFGTFAGALNPEIVFTRPGVLRGLIAPSGAVTLDLAGKDFFNQGAQVQYYPDVYVRLSINGVEIF